MLPNSSKPIGQTPDEPRLQIVTASVHLTIDIHGQRAVIDINRLLREPFWSLSLWEVPEGEITLTRNEDIDDDFAKFNLTIQKAVDG
jgi:hypothetical protein